MHYEAIVISASKRDRITWLLWDPHFGGSRDG